MATKGGDEMSHETTVRQRFPEAVCEPAYEGWGGQRMVFYMLGDDLIRQMVEMSKEEGLVDFAGWIKAAEKYLEGK